MKPDQLIKRRGKLGLIKVNIELTEVQQWVNERFNQDVQVYLTVNGNSCYKIEIEILCYRLEKLPENYGGL